MKFNDDQIADDKSISNMKIKYANLTPYQRVKALQEQGVEDDAVTLGQSMQDADKYLQFLQERSSVETSDFIRELRRLNNAELAELMANFDSLNDLDRRNPRFICRPYNTCLLNKEIVKNELVILAEMFELYVRETRPEVRRMLERMIRRRIEMLGLMLLRPNGV